LTHARLGTDDAAKEDERNALAFDLLQSFGAGVVELHFLPSAFVIDAGPRPEASASEAWQAGRSAEVTNLRHRVDHFADEARRAAPYANGRSRRAGDSDARMAGPARDVALAKLQVALSGLRARTTGRIDAADATQHELLEPDFALETDIILMPRRPA